MEQRLLQSRVRLLNLYFEIVLPHEPASMTDPLLTWIGQPDLCIRQGQISDPRQQAGTLLTSNDCIRLATNL